MRLKLKLFDVQLNLYPGASIGHIPLKFCHELAGTALKKPGSRHRRPGNLSIESIVAPAD